MMNRAFLGLSFLGLAAAAACGDTVSLEDRPCPCASGWTCCAEQNVCVAPGVVCPVPVAQDGGSSDAQAPSNPIELAMAQSARCMATDADHVYWKNSDGLIVGAPKAGGTIEVSHFETPVAADARCGLAVDGKQIYGTAQQYGKIVKLDLESNGEWVIGSNGSFFGQLAGPSSLALDETWIYVTEYEGGTVKKLPKSGTGDAIVIASGLTHPDNLLIDDSFVYWVDVGTTGGDGGLSTDGAVMKVSKDGGDVTTLVGGLTFPDGFTRNGRRLYWIDWNGELNAVDTDGQNRATLTSNEFAFGAITADSTSVYWGSSTAVRRVAQSGGSPATVYPHTGNLNAVVVDDTRVYWSNGAEVWTGLK